MPDVPSFRIFVLDDDSITRRLLEAAFTAERFDVRTFGSVAHASPAALRDPYDLYLLDIVLPDGDGIDMCRSLRAKTRAPIVMLTSRGELEDVVRGLEAGADDYIVKPFRMGEVVARVRAQLRRAGELNRAAEADDVARFDDLLIDRGLRDAIVGGRPAVLSQREFEVVDFLARNAGRAVSRETIIDSVWGDAEEVSEKILNVYIHRIRCKIEENPDEPRHLQTVRGFGYKLS